MNKERFRFKCLTDTLNYLNSNKIQQQQQNHSYYSSLTQFKREEIICDILRLINNLINQVKQAHERIRIRYEFIGLKIMDFLIIKFKLILLKKYIEN